MKTLADDFAARGCPLPLDETANLVFCSRLSREDLILLTCFAVNHFDRLVAALKPFADIWNGNQDGTTRIPWEALKEADRLLADIAAARQEGNHAK